MQLESSVSPWYAIALGFMASVLVGFVLEPEVVDFIVQGVLALPEESRQTPMLLLDLVLSTVALAATLYGIAWFSSRPKVLATTTVAALLLVCVALVVWGTTNDLPTWYKWASCLSIALSWVVAGLWHHRTAGP